MLMTDKKVKMNIMLIMAPAVHFTPVCLVKKNREARLNG